MSDEPAMMQREEWSAELAQMVTNGIGPHDGPILVYAEDHLGGVMSTVVIFRRGERLLAPWFSEPNEREVPFRIQSLYQQWGGQDSDIRALRMIIDGDNVSVQLLSVSDIAASKGSGFRSRLSAHTIEVFGRDWRKGDGDRPEIFQRLDEQNNRELRRERMREQLRRMLEGPDREEQ